MCVCVRACVRAYVCMCVYVCIYVCLCVYISTFYLSIYNNFCALHLMDIYSIIGGLNLPVDSTSQCVDSRY
jgi:hypothetical protein